MNPKTIVTAALLGFVAISVGYLGVSETQTADDSLGRSVSGRAVPAAQSDVKAPAHKIIAYYFHNTQRCPTCLKIERLAGDAIKTEFAGELERGELEWRVLNIEESANEHFVGDYALVASSLVIVDLHEGRQRAWTNMERVWELVHDDEAAFRDYVVEQVREYLEPQP
jgi:hypothetical protein